METTRLRDKLRAVSVQFGSALVNATQEPPKAFPEASKLGPLAQHIVTQYSELDRVLDAVLCTKRAVEYASSTTGVLPDAEARAKRHEDVDDLVDEAAALAASLEARSLVMATPVA